MDDHKVAALKRSQHQWISINGTKLYHKYLFVVSPFLRNSHHQDIYTFLVGDPKQKHDLPLFLGTTQVTTIPKKDHFWGAYYISPQKIMQEVHDHEKAVPWATVSSVSFKLIAGPIR